jgi:glutaconate CoA-transferase subunit A
MIVAILFWSFSAVLVGAALGVILSRNPVHSVLHLVLCFFNAAVLWLLIEAEFLAIVLVLVYVGAVMVLFLFVVMMLDINLEKRYKAGDMILEDYSHGAMAMRFLAGAVGAPFIPYSAPLGSDLYNPKYDAMGKAGMRDGKDPRIPKKKFIQMEEPFWGEGDTILLPSARPELAIIHVAQCGDKGTARWRGIGTIDKEISFAADKVVILAEEVVPESEMRKLPEGNQIPYFVVDAIVECPWGAFPSSVPFYYDYDAPFMRDMDKVSRNADDQKKWMDEWVFGPKTWEEFIVKLGAKRLLDLKADSVTGYSTRMMRGKKPAPRMKMPLSVAMSGY